MKARPSVSPADEIGTDTDDERELERLVSGLLVGDVEPLVGLFLSEGGQPPTLVWDPTPRDLELERLRSLLALWREREARAGGLPDPGWIEPDTLRFALGYLMLLDVLEDGSDFRYRLYGTEISRRFMRDLTGHRVSAVPFRLTRLFFLSVYRAAYLARRPIYTWHAPPADVLVDGWSRLVLPLSADGETVDRFLVGNIPGSWREPAPAMLPGD